MREIESMSVIEKALLLSKWPLFERIPTDELALVAARTTEVEYEAGEEVVPEGPSGDSVHFVVSGAVDLVSGNRSIRRVSAGEVVGSLAILEDVLPDEIFRVLEPTHAILLSRTNLESAISDHPDFAMALIRTLVTLVRRLGSELQSTSEEVQN